MKYIYFQYNFAEIDFVVKVHTNWRGFFFICCIPELLRSFLFSQINSAAISGCDYEFVLKEGTTFIQAFLVGFLLCY